MFIIHKNYRVAANKQYPGVNFPNKMRSVLILYLIHRLCFHVKLVLHLKQLAFCNSDFFLVKKIDVIDKVAYRVNNVSFVLPLVIWEFDVHSGDWFTRANIDRHNSTQIIHEDLFSKNTLRKPYFFICSHKQMRWSY